MNARVKVTGLILGGYLLGRSKKLKLAMTIAGTAAGTTLMQKRHQVKDQVTGTVGQVTDSSPELKSLQEKVTGRLADSGRGAARAMAAKGIDQVGQKLQERTDRMKAELGETEEAAPDDAEEARTAPAEDDEIAEEPPADEVDEPAGEVGEDEEPAAEEPAEEEPAKPARRSRSTKSGSATSRGGSRGSTRSTPSTRKQSTTSRTSSTSRTRKGDSDE